MMNLETVLTKSPSMVTRKTGSEYVLVPVSDNIADMNSVYTLNETGAFLWELIDGRKSVTDLIDSLVNEYDADRETATRDVFSFLEEMNKYLIIIS
jgi:Coenzyme PQQ synthesis protein D (PqqD)